MKKDNSRVIFINLRGKEVLYLAKVRDVVLYHQGHFWRHGEGDLEEQDFISLSIIIKHGTAKWTKQRFLVGEVHEE